MSGFLSRVSRYARPTLVEQRENRLTEVFAAALERTDGLALHLAKEWLSPDPGMHPSAEPASWSAARVALDEDGLALRLPVRTQRLTRSAKLVDLELRFRRQSSSSADDVVIWVEVKHGANPHENQLSNYIRDLAGLNVRAGAVVLLAPRWSYPFVGAEPEPPGVPQRTWQQTAARCGRWRSADGVQRFLVKEFLDYLQEESLMDPDVITPRPFISWHLRSTGALLKASCLRWRLLPDTSSANGTMAPVGTSGPVRLWGTGRPTRKANAASHQRNGDPSVSGTGISLETTRCWMTHAAGCRSSTPMTALRSWAR